MGSFKQTLLNVGGFCLILYTLYVMSAYMNIKYDTTGIYMFWFIALMIFHGALPTGDGPFGR